MNSTHTELLMANYTIGMQLHGRISAVRRFLCLFVTFDFLYTALFWVICILIDGNNILDALKKEILYYSIYNSMFDVVIVALIRFLLLIIFYAMVHINHWWLVATTTALSCAFLIVKTLMYEWTKDSSYPFEVMLVLTSFLIAWAEAWYVDFRILPQEQRANSVLEAVAGNNTDEVSELSRQLPQLERVSEYLSQYTESVANFYSPMESLAGSEDEDDVPKIKKLSVENEYLRIGEETLMKAVQLVKSAGWNLEKTITHSDHIFSKEVSKGHKVYKLVAVIDYPAESLFNECVYNFEQVPQWNKTLNSCQIIQSVSHDCDVTYQISADAPGGVLTSRDFVNVRLWRKVGDTYIIAGKSVVHSQVPVAKSLVRGENGPTCFMLNSVTGAPQQCCLVWLLDLDLKGWIPRYIIEQAMLTAIKQFLTCTKEYTAEKSTLGRESHDADMNARYSL